MAYSTERGLPARDDILRRTFTPRGENAYDKDEVDAFMSELADEISAGLYDRIGSEIAALLQATEDAAQRLQLAADGRASATLQSAAQKAEQLVSEAERYAREQQQVTERRCLELLKEAAATLRISKQKAERMVNEAESYAVRVTESADRHLEALERHRHGLLERMNLVAQSVTQLQAELAEDETIVQGEKRRASTAEGRPELAVIVPRTNEDETVEDAKEALGRGLRE
jgi:DivIVA domain-containing protein